MTILTIGDIHLTKLSHRIPDFDKLLMKTLRTTLDEGAKRGVNTVVMVGDIFNDPHPSQSAIIDFLNVVTDYNDMEFLIIPGNHDFADITTDSLQLVGWTKKLKSNIRLIKQPELIKIDGYRYYFMPHPFINDMPSKADFGFAHFAANGARGENGFVVRSKNQPKGNWILGDFHEAQEGKAKGCRYEYVGSLAQLSWEEKPKKSVIYIEDGEKTRRKVDLAYKLIKYIVESDEELEQLTIEKGNFYYVRTKNGYLLPKDWAISHPEVVRQGALGVKKDKRAALLVDEAVVHPLANLEPFLLSKKIEQSVVIRALELSKSLKLRDYV